MRETQFIEQNKGKWAKFEHVLKQKKKDPEEMSNLFMEITDDLSYSRTFYPNRSVRVYLNNIAQKVFYSIYRNRKSRFKRFVQFWKDDVPQILFESRKDLLLSFLIFMLGVAIGVFSSMMDIEFPRIVLGDAYVDMTYDNIQKGNPMAVYQDAEQTSMFMHIALNNLRVAFMTFALGLLFGAGTIYILLFNGIMLGAFQYLFIQKGIYLDSIFTIWLHGTIEIACIVIAGAAGIHLGKGLIFKGTYSPMQSLQISGRRALLIFLTISPLIILAAFIEGYITRYSDAPLWVRAALVFSSLFFMLGYFVWYPWRKAKRGFVSYLREANLPPSKEQAINFKNIKNSGQIFSDAFSFYRQNLATLATLASILAFSYTTIILFLEKDYYVNSSHSLFFFFEAIGGTFSNISQILFQPTYTPQWALNTGFMSVMAFFSMHKIARLAMPNDPSIKSFGYFLQTAVATIIVCFGINSLLLINNDEQILILFLFITCVFPILILTLSTVFNDKTNLFAGFVRSLKLIGSGNWQTMMGAYIVMVLMCFVFMFLTTAPVLDFYQRIILDIFPFSNEDVAHFHTTFHVFILSFMLCFLFPLVFSVLSIAHFSFRETAEANDLKAQIPTIGLRKKSYGMERE